LTLVLLLAVTAFMPVQGLAQEDKALEQAIRAVKAKIEVPQNFTEFNYYTYSDGDRISWYLDWNSKDMLEGSLSVRVDDRGDILSYSLYRPYDYDSARKFPKISRQEARGTAEAFIERMKPGLLSGLELEEQSGLQQLGRTHSFTYIRLENGIPYPANTVNVEVNSETGEVQSYSYNWSEDARFPQPADVIDLDGAQRAYKEQLGLKLIYEYSYEDEVSRVYAVYVPVYGSNYGIDALTGEKIRVNPYYGVYPLRGAQEADMEKSMGGASALTPEEQKAVEEMASMVSREKAESIARGLRELEITRGYKLAGSYLQKELNAKGSYTWEFNFESEGQENGRPSNIWVRLDARDGSLKGYNRYIPIDGQREGKYTEDKARAAVEKFVKAVSGGKFDDMVFDPAYEENYYPLAEGKNPVSYTFHYTREVNGVQFPANYIHVGFDAVNGKVTSFNMSWYDLEFPSMEGVLEMEDIYDKLFADVGLALMYSNIYKENHREAVIYREQPEIRLVYSVKQDKPAIFDAFSGEILDGSGKPFVEKKAVEYTDIDGHFAENQIAALAEYGISLPGTEFRPGQNIAQKDYLRLLAKAMGYYGSFDDDKGLEDLYNRLIRERVITKEEKNPDGAVTREEAVKFLVRALGYQDVADIKGIFVTGFKDQGSIDPALVGYVAIAKGLGIVGGSGGYFNPKNSVTRAETAVMLYNYLTR
jgi:hypothetical protein